MLVLDNISVLNFKQRYQFLNICAEKRNIEPKIIRFLNVRLTFRLKILSLFLDCPCRSST